MTTQASDVVHYAPVGQPLCGDDDPEAAHTAAPTEVIGCRDCLALVLEDIEERNFYRGQCLHCGKEVVGLGGIAWRAIVRRPCPHCGRTGW